MTEPPVTVWLDRSGALLRLRLARPHANVLDSTMIAALDADLARNENDDGLKGVLIDAEGRNFSYGASVEEHRPDQCAAMLKAMHGLVRHIAGYPVPVMFAVHGQCLGGGLEIVAAGHLVFAAPNAQFGQPEIKLGVFAPAASCFLPERIGQMAAEDMLMSGRTIAADAPSLIGLVTGVATDPEGAALAYFDEHLAAKSASSLRHAVAAVRDPFIRRLDRMLDEVERRYVDELMATRDAAEGIAAFLDKRPAQWENR